jgi:hypothetical protein
MNQNKMMLSFNNIAVDHIDQKNEKRMLTPIR